MYNTYLPRIETRIRAKLKGPAQSKNETNLSVMYDTKISCIILVWAGAKKL